MRKLGKYLTFVSSNNNMKKEFIKKAALDFKRKLESLNIETTGLNVSENLYGVSIYFDGSDAHGHKFKFRFSDHDCQRAIGEYEKVSVDTDDQWCIDYEKAVYPDRFEWEYLDKYIPGPNGTKIQCKRLIGRKSL